MRLTLTLPAWAVWIIGCLSLTHPINKLIDVYFWDKVLHVVEPYAHPLFGLAKDYGLALAFLLLGLYLSTSAKDRSTAWYWVRRNLNLYIIIASVGFLLIVGAVVAYLIDLSRGPIDWVTSTGSPIAFESDSNGKFLVTAFNIIGVNRTDKAVLPSNAYIRSDISEKIVPLKFVGVVGGPLPSDQVVIEPEGRLNLLSDTIALNPESFRDEYGRFTFVFEYAGKRIERSFGSTQVNDLIDEARKYHASLGKGPPGVRRR